MNTITMKVLQEALAALTAARKLALDSKEPYSLYQQIMSAEINLRVRMEHMQPVEVIE